MLRRRFKGLSELNVLSYGPCQTPTLGFIVERFLAHKNFVADPFWSIKVVIKTAGKGCSSLLTLAVLVTGVCRRHGNAAVGAAAIV